MAIAISSKALEEGSFTVGLSSLLTVPYDRGDAPLESSRRIRFNAPCITLRSCKDRAHVAVVDLDIAHRRRDV